MTLPRIYWALFVLLAAVVLATTPVAAGFSARAPAFCDFGPAPDWAETVLNFKHLFAYGLLATAAFLALRERPWLALGVVLAITGVVEVQQSVFADGHCRLRDMIPNVLATGIGFAGALAVAAFVNRQSRAAK